MKKYNLFLDDVRMPDDCVNYRTALMPENRRMYTMERWIIARNYKEFTKMVEMNYLAGYFPEKVSFDHDLAAIHYDPRTWKESFEYTEETGNDCAKWFVQFCIDKQLDLPECFVHSMNPVGGRKITETLNDFYRYKSKL